MTKLIRCSVLFACVIGLGACGFHLRGQEDTALPEVLHRIKVVRTGPVSKELTQDLTHALRNIAGVEVSEEDSKEKLPGLVISQDKLERRVLAVSAVNTKISNYLLRYHVSFQVKADDGKVLLAPQTILLQRSYSANQTDVVAKAHEEEALERALRSDAVQQILFRLTTIDTKIEPASGHETLP